jgi:hypothetical protein
MTIAPNPNQLQTPYVPTIEALSEAFASKYSYLELVYPRQNDEGETVPSVFTHDDILSGFADAHDVLMSEILSDERDPKPVQKKNQETGETTKEWKERTPHPVDAESVGLAQAAMARYSVAYGLATGNPDWILNSCDYFKAAELQLNRTAGDSVGRTLNAARAAEAAALIGDEEALETYGTIAGWDYERKTEVWNQYADIGDVLNGYWDRMKTDAVSFKPDIPLNEDGSGSLYSAESQEYSRNAARAWGIGRFAMGYNIETPAAKLLYKNHEEADLGKWKRIHHARVLRMAGLTREEIAVHPMMQPGIPEGH